MVHNLPHNVLKTNDKRGMDQTVATPSDDESPKLQLSYQLLFEQNPLPMWVYDARTLRLLAVNQAAVEHAGYTRQEFVALTLADLHHPDDVPAMQEQLKLPMSERAVQRIWRLRHRNGDWIEVETQTRELALDGMRAHMVVARDLTAQRRAEQSQRDLVHELTATLENLPNAFFTLDRDWRFTYINARAEEVMRSSRSELLGCNVWEKFPDAVGSIFQIEYQRVMAEGKPASFEAYYAPLGVWRQVDAYPSASGLAVHYRDVTGRHLIEQHLLGEQETLSTVINSTNDAIISVDTEGLIKTFNPGAERIFHRTRESLQGHSMEVLLPERFRAAHQQHLRRFAASGTSNRMMGLSLVKGLRPDGQEIDLEGTISQVSVLQQQVLIVSLRDVTERVRAHEELQQSKAQLTDLTHKLLSQEKTLVKRLSQALHDQLGQTMTAIRMVHETILASQRDNPSPGAHRLEQQLGTLISQAMHQIRQVLTDLRPPLLEEQGLASALDNELRNRSLTQPLVDISIQVPSEITLMRWPTEVEYAAFMIAREAVENALRHSGASAVSVRLSGGGLSLLLEVADNGAGIPDGGAPRSGHLGILGMHERANAIGAKITFSSGENQGACVSFNWVPAS